MYLIDSKNNPQKIDPSSFFINSESQARWIEWNLIEWCSQNFTSPEKIFLDIGSHIGTYAWSLAPYYSKVAAFECNPDVYNCLCSNIFLKGLSSKVDAYNIGLSCKEGHADYFIRSPDGGGNGITILSESDLSRKKLKVDLRTLDSYDFEDVGFMKIDVEGHEKEVLQGAIKTLKRNGHPPFIFESWLAGWPERPRHAAELRSDLFDYVRSLDYDIIEIMGYPEMFLAVHKIKN